MDITSFLLGLQKGKASSNNDGTSYTVVRQTITGTGGEQIVQHGCGVVPDIVIISTNGVPSENCIFFTVGFSTAMKNRLTNANSDYEDYFGFVKVLLGVGTMYFQTRYGIESSTQDFSQYGLIKSATKSQFTIGGDTYSLADGEKYSAFYICGIT